MLKWYQVSTVKTALLPHKYGQNAGKTAKMLLNVELAAFSIS